MMILFEKPEGAGKLVGAACAARIAVYAFQTGDDLVYLHSFAEFGNTLGVAVAASCKLDLTYDVAFSLDVNLDRADCWTGLE